MSIAAYLLADHDYDVWLGNARGNRYSRNHSTLDPDASKFWDFSWHEIGMYDLPAMIDYILKATGYKKLQYAGHSQGCTAFFVMCSMRPSYNEKVLSMHAMAPAVYAKETEDHPYIRAISLYFNVSRRNRGVSWYEYIYWSDLKIVKEFSWCKELSFLMF